MHLISVFLFSLVWGSFLNVVAYRLIRGKSIVRPRSACPHCESYIAWYDNIPVLSWLFLGGTCRSCKAPISYLYPLIELLTAISLTLLFLYVPKQYFLSYAVLFSALIISIRTDLEHMLLLPYLLYTCIPIAYAASYFNLLPISFTQSILGSCVGYALLWSIAKAFTLITCKQGMGDGDFDLLACIGAFVGIKGVFYSLCIGAWVGSIISIIYLLITKQSKEACIPFAPFLALGAMTYICFGTQIDYFVLRHMLIS